MTRTLARQMSGPVPSPSMKGMTGLSGTRSLPSRIEILAPWAGGVIFDAAAVDMDLLPGRPRKGSGAHPAPYPRMLAQGIPEPVCERLAGLRLRDTNNGGLQAARSHMHKRV